MIDIVSVTYKSEEYLKLNYELTNEINSEFHWVVVCNDHNTKLSHIGEFECVNGVDMPAEISCNVNKHSHHHGLGLNEGLKYTSQRFVLLLDPDFYVVHSHKSIIDYMIKHELSIFGAPYANDGKWRPFPNFPTAFCMYVDTTKAAVDEWDFSPKPQADQTKWYDTGHKVYERYADHPGCFECVKHIKNQYTTLKADEYTWKSKLFGIHARMKMHHKNADNNKLHQIRTAITKARSNA